MNYDAIAPFYDAFNGGFDHGAYFERIKQALSPYVDFPFGDCAALDCGCGTGSLTAKAAEAGFDCTGVDISPYMLSEASSKPELSECRFVLQSLPEIDLYRAYDLVLCCLDTVNHLEKEDLAEFFRRIYNFTELNGFFVFDAKTEAEFRRSSHTVYSYEEDAVLLYKGKYSKPYMKTELRAEFYTEEGRATAKTSVTERFYSNKEIKSLMAATPFTYIGRYSWNRGERTVFIYRKELPAHHGQM